MFRGGRGKKSKVRIIRAVELSLSALGLALIGFYAVARLDGYVNSRVDLEEAQTSRALPPSGSSAMSGLESAPQASWASPVDFRHWSASRIAAFERFVDVKPARPIAVLQIPKLDLEVPVFKGTGKLSLNRGVGWIEGTAAPGHGGNIGIAGHRDSFFRGLRYLDRGDEILLATKEGTDFYRVNRAEIVRPSETSVLKSDSGRSLTLVTCYPFYYIGRAPRRFVVEANLRSETEQEEFRKRDLRK